MAKKAKTTSNKNFVPTELFYLFRIEQKECNYLIKLIVFISYNWKIETIVVWLCLCDAETRGL